MATYNLKMKSSVKGKTESVELPCSVVPDTVKALKDEIEEQLNVPTSLQTLSHKGETLEDNDAKLKKIGLKTRDTVEVMLDKTLDYKVS